MVEFALVAPLALVLLLGIVIAGMYVTNEVRIGNALTDVARAGAVCSTSYYSGPVINATHAVTLPDGTPCSSTRFSSYLSSQLDQIDHQFAWSPTVSIRDQSSGSVIATQATADFLKECSPGNPITISVTYQQQLYVPFLGILFGSTNDTAPIKAEGTATCQ